MEFLIVINKALQRNVQGLVLLGQLKVITEILHRCKMKHSQAE
jgi:hypothetical protein